MSRVFDFEDKVRELVSDFSDVPYYEIADSLEILSVEYRRKSEQENEL